MAITYVIYTIVLLIENSIPQTDFAGYKTSVPSKPKTEEKRRDRVK